MQVLCNLPVKQVEPTQVQVLQLACYTCYRAYTGAGVTRLLDIYTPTTTHTKIIYNTLYMKDQLMYTTKLTIYYIHTKGIQQTI